MLEAPTRRKLKQIMVKIWGKSEQMKKGWRRIEIRRPLHLPQSASAFNSFLSFFPSLFLAWVLSQQAPLCFFLFFHSFFPSSPYSCSWDGTGSGHPCPVSRPKNVSERTSCPMSRPSRFLSRPDWDRDGTGYSRFFQPLVSFSHIE